MLDVSGNQLINLSSISNAHFLKVLNVTNNQIETFKGFKGHKFLEKLLLQGNKLNHLDGLYNLPSLK